MALAIPGRLDSLSENCGYRRRDSPSALVSVNQRTFDLPKKDISGSRWFKQPKIPIHMNMSTMLRMKNNNENKLIEGDSVQNEDRQRGALTTKTMIPSERRMFDYMMEKFETIDSGDLYSKSLVWSMVAENQSKYSGGDRIGEGSVYQRVAAISVNEPCGRNLKYVEKISISSRSGRRERISMGDSGVVAPFHPCENTEDFEKLRISQYGSVGDAGGGEGITMRKKRSKRGKKPVVVMCLKNTCRKYVKKT